MPGGSDKLAALATMSLAQLRGEWLQAFKVPAPEPAEKMAMER